MSFGRSLIALALLALCGCQTGMKQMDTTEAAVIFRRLPPILGGGLSSRIVRPGEMVIVWPWDTLYRFDTKVHSVQFGKSEDAANVADDFVQTRALDGNEVALAVRIEYSVTDDPASLVKLVNEVATSNDEVAEIVAAVARADIRTHMNKLKTSEFFVNESKYKGEQEVKLAMQERLKSYGIVVRSVNLKEHRFERVLPDNTIDRSYQEKINEVQTRNEQTNREKLRKATVKADKEREYNDAQAEVNRQLAEAAGYKEQAELRGAAYFESKGNEAEAIKATGMAEVEAITEQIAALSGPGGEALLKLEIARQLIKTAPRFVLMSESSGAGLSVNKVDTNNLLTQMGIVQALQEEPKNQTLISEGAAKAAAEPPKN